MKPQRQDSRWHVHRRRQRVVREENGLAIISLGEANVWDYGDLVRLRETANALISAGRRKVGVDLSHVAFLPSGFMNMLCEWTEKGLKVWLLNPQENVREMRWFNEFTRPTTATMFRVDCSQGPARGTKEFQDEDIGSGEIRIPCDFSF